MAGPPAAPETLVPRGSWAARPAPCPHSPARQTPARWSRRCLLLSRDIFPKTKTAGAAIPSFPPPQLFLPEKKSQKTLPLPSLTSPSPCNNPRRGNLRCLPDSPTSSSPVPAQLGAGRTHPRKPLRPHLPARSPVPGPRAPSPAPARDPAPQQPSERSRSGENFAKRKGNIQAQAGKQIFFFFFPLSLLFFFLICLPRKLDLCQPGS